MPGSDGHKPDCACPLCRGAARVAERERAEAEQAQTRRDAAWFAVMGAGGPDAVIALARQHGDLPRARRLLAAAGLDADGIIGRWRAEAPQVRQFSSGGDPWGASPDHDERVTTALLRGAGDGELARIRAEVAAEYWQAAAEKTVRRESSVMWRTRDGETVMDGTAAPMGVSLSPAGAPVQTSRVDESVPPLGADHA